MGTVPVERMPARTPRCFRQGADDGAAARFEVGVRNVPVAHVISDSVAHVKLTPALTGLFGPPITDTLDYDKPAQADRVVMSWQSLAFWRASLS